MLLAQVWKYDFRLVTQALFTVFGFCFGGGAVAWGAASYLGVSSLSFLQVLCAYGYSLTAFIPAAVRRKGTLLPRRTTPTTPACPLADFVCTACYCGPVGQRRRSHPYIWHISDEGPLACRARRAASSARAGALASYPWRARRIWPRAEALLFLLFSGPSVIIDRLVALCHAGRDLPHVIVDLAGWRTPVGSVGTGQHGKLSCQCARCASLWHSHDERAHRVTGNLNVAKGPKDVNLAIGNDKPSARCIFYRVFSFSTNASDTTDGARQVVAFKRFHISDLERFCWVGGPNRASAAWLEYTKQAPLVYLCRGRRGATGQQSRRDQNRA